MDQDTQTALTGIQSVIDAAVKSGIFASAADVVRAQQFFEHIAGKLAGANTVEHGSNNAQ